MNLNPRLLLAKAPLLLLAGCGGASDNGGASAAERTADSVAVTTLSSTDSVVANPVAATDLPADPDTTRIDYLTFAEGAVPLSIGGPGAEAGINVDFDSAQIRPDSEALLAELFAGSIDVWR